MTEKNFKPGEKGFAVFLLLFGGYFFQASVKLYLENPKPSSYGAVPLFVSSLIVLFSLAILINDRKKTSETKGLPAGKKILTTLAYIFPKDILIMMGLILAYCTALYQGVGFIVSTSLFLWVGICYLLRKNYVKNVLWTACCMAFILVVFRYLFSVVLP